MEKQGHPSFETALVGLVGIDRVNALILQVFTQAEDGCRASQNMVLKRLLPELKAVDRAVSFQIADGYQDSVKLVLDQMATGRLTPDEGGRILTAMASAERAGEKIQPQQTMLQIIGGIDPSVIPANEVEVSE